VPDEPILINGCPIDVDWHLHRIGYLNWIRHLYFLLHFHRTIDVDWLVDKDWLIDHDGLLVDWLVHVHCLFYDLGNFYLPDDYFRHLFLHLDVLGHLHDFVD
jgi:hypothetical protein